MRLIRKQIIVLAILVITGCAQYETAVEKLEWLEPDTFTCDVVRVKSGNSFLCKFPDLEIDTIRLAGMTIPVDKQEEAKKYSESILRRGTLVNIEPDKDAKDLYGGIPAYVFVPGGKMLNILLLEKGYAEAARDEVNVKYKAVFIKTEVNNRGGETEVIDEVETENKPWIK